MNCFKCKVECAERHWTCEAADDLVWCCWCFALTPCGWGRHGEGCAKQVFRRPAEPVVRAVEQGQPPLKLSPNMRDCSHDYDSLEAVLDREWEGRKDKLKGEALIEKLLGVKLEVKGGD